MCVSDLALHAASAQQLLPGSQRPQRQRRHAPLRAARGHCACVPHLHPSEHSLPCACWQAPQPGEPRHAHRPPAHPALEKGSTLQPRRALRASTAPSLVAPASRCAPHERKTRMLHSLRRCLVALSRCAFIVPPARLTPQCLCSVGRTQAGRRSSAQGTHTTRRSEGLLPFLSAALPKSEAAVPVERMPPTRRLVVGRPLMLLVRADALPGPQRRQRGEGHADGGSVRQEKPKEEGGRPFMTSAKSRLLPGAEGADRYTVT